MVSWSADNPLHKRSPYRNNLIPQTESQQEPSLTTKEPTPTISPTSSPNVLRRLLNQKNTSPASTRVSPNDVLYLQGIVGNRQVARLLNPVNNQNAQAGLAQSSLNDRETQPAIATASPPVTGVVARAHTTKKAKIPKRQIKTRYNKVNYLKSSKFRFIRFRRRALAGYATKTKAGINLLTIKYKKGTKSFYLTTRSVPNTNAKSFKIEAGHSEQRYAAIKDKFEKRHKLTQKHLVYAATEREPCGHGPGLANCRCTLENLGIPDNKIYFTSSYVDGSDMRLTKKEKLSEVNDRASEHRHDRNEDFAKTLKSLTNNHDSDDESENESDVNDEYESDYEENVQPRRKKPIKKLAKAFRGGFDKDY